MFKPAAVFGLAFMLLVTTTAASFASSGSERRDYAIGWQFSRPTSGISLKIPVADSYYLQPILALNMSQKEKNTDGRLGIGLRGILDLSTHNYYHPYAGAAWGYSERFGGDSPGDSKVSQVAHGFEGFFGVEYQKYLLRPAFEIGMGSFRNSDGSYYAGLVYNLSVLYYF